MKKSEFSNRRYLDALESRVLIFDGAMGTSLQLLNLTSDDFGGEQYNGCNDYLVLTKPAAVEGVHRSFLDAGADVLETNTFRSNRLTLADFGLGHRVFEINQTAAELARRIADEFSTKELPRFVAGSIGPTGKLISADDPDLSNITYKELVDVYREQAVGLLRGDVDLLLIETSQDILEVKAAIHGLELAFEETGKRIPIQAQITLDTSGRMLLGTDITAALTILEQLPIDVIGLNCSTGPEHMREPIQYLGEHATLPVSCIPNAGLPMNVDGEAVYPLKPEPFAEALEEFVKKFNISVVGGCCGTGPEHIRQLADALHNHPHPARPRDAEPRLASAIRSISMHQEPRPLLIGERINTQGSRIAKRLVMEQDFDAIIELGRSQVERGAHALDICVALTEHANEAEMMHIIVHKLAMSVDAPLVIDSTEPDVMRVALEAAPGRCIINSVHLESGREKLDQIVELAKAHGAALIALTIDEKGMAKTAQRKLEVAKRIYDIVVNEHGLHPSYLIFDALTFTMATGDPEFVNSAAETMEGIKLIKAAMPDSFTSLGVSNCSFGLSPKARHVINSVMLYHCVLAGLDMAIVNPAVTKPYAEIQDEERKLAEDLIFNRDPEALQRVIEHFDTIGSEEEDQAADPTAGMSPQERLHWRILRRHKEGVEADIDEIILDHALAERSDAAVTLLNTVLLPAMKEVGDKFGAGELILPFVLQSAEVMKKSVAHLETYLERKEGVSKGIVVLATVYGDVHDIGKNLVKTILSNNGYTVHDLGKQVPANMIIDAAVEHKADAIGLSALLVSTSKQMPLIVNELNRRNLNFPVLIGGAAINRRFGRRILFTEDESPYKPGVFYCKDAFEGLSVIDQLQNPEKRTALIQKNVTEAEREMERAPSEARVPGKTHTIESAHIPAVQTYGPRIVEEMPLEIVFKHLALTELFRLSWGAKNSRGKEWDTLKASFEERLTSMKAEALKEVWLKPQGVYGLWPAQADGDTLRVYDPASLASSEPQTLCTFNFPRQRGGDRLCIADYFTPVGSEQMDVVALQVVTVGAEATQRFDALQDKGEYSEAYYVHGLAVQTAEASADYLHQHILRELGLPVEQGKRYSWGYPALPELEDHQKVFELLPVESALGMKLTSAYQLVPEQSTAAIIVHHPAAKYFSAGVSRVDQLMKADE
ncbi:MAG: methionine synthase [Anaerolineales bacterium]|nr:methionine synthase [Anaerolineales bacterium]